MFGIIVIAHDTLATALCSTAESIAGAQEHLHALDLPSDEAPATFRERLAALLSEVGAATDGILLLADLAGGTPCNVAVGLVRGTPPTRHLIVAGVSLAMLLEALAVRGNCATLTELAKEVLLAGTPQAYGWRAQGDDD